MAFSITTRTTVTMKTWILKHRKILLLAINLMVFPAALLCRYLSGRMLQTVTVCNWRRIGAQCPSCGGTHFVNALCSGDFLGALQHNAFLFLVVLFLAVSMILVDIAVWFDRPFAKKALKKMYTIPVLIVFSGIFITFLILRNWHIFVLPFK